MLENSVEMVSYDGTGMNELMLAHEALRDFATETGVLQGNPTGSKEKPTGSKEFLLIAVNSDGQLMD